MYCTVSFCSIFLVLFFICSSIAYTKFQKAAPSRCGDMLFLGSTWGEHVLHSELLFDFLGTATIQGTVAASLKSKTNHLSSPPRLPVCLITHIRRKSPEPEIDIQFPFSMSQVAFFWVFEALRSSKNSRAKDATGDLKKSVSFLWSPTITERRERSF